MLHQIRVRLADRPGSLGRVTWLLGALGVDIQQVVVLGRESGRAVDEFTVELPGSVTRERLTATLADAAPRLFGADWAALLGPDGSVAYGSVAAPSQVDLPEPLRARAYESEEMRCAMAPLGTDGVVLVLARTDAPAFHVAELDRLIQLVDAVAVVLAGRPVTA